MEKFSKIALLAPQICLSSAPPGAPPTCSAASGVGRVAEGVGFEPTNPCGFPVFKTGAIDHSTTPPQRADPRLCRSNAVRATGPTVGSIYSVIRAVQARKLLLPGRGMDHSPRQPPRPITYPDRPRMDAAPTPATKYVLILDD